LLVEQYRIETGIEGVSTFVGRYNRAICTFQTRRIQPGQKFDGAYCIVGSLLLESTRTRSFRTQDSYCNYKIMIRFRVRETQLGVC